MPDFRLAGQISAFPFGNHGVGMSRSTTKERSDKDPLVLGNQLCFAMHAAARAITKTYMETLRGAGLTYPQYLVLIVLLEHDKLSVSEIGKLLHLDFGTLTPLLKRMEADGLVVRQRSDADERAVFVTLTSKGRGLRRTAKKARELVVERLAMSDRDIGRLRNELLELSVRLAPA